MLELGALARNTAQIGITPTMVIACCALAFTIASFWWIQAKQGKLKGYAPHSFAASIGKQVILLRFPVVVYNTGAKPIVVQDFRLTFLGENALIAPFEWRSTRSQVMPSSEDSNILPSVFAVDGRKAQQLFIEFGGSFPSMVPDARDYLIEIEVRIGHRDDWESLVVFTLRAAHIHTPKRFLAYSNTLESLTPRIQEEAAFALSALRNELNSTD